MIAFVYLLPETKTKGLSTCYMLAKADTIAAIKAGDESIIERLYDQYRGVFLNWGPKHFPLPEETLIDIYQDAVIILYQNIVEEKVSELQSSLQTYLFGIAKHLIYRELKRRRHSALQMDEIPEVAIGPQYLQQAEQDHQQQLLQNALAQLGDSCRRMLEYFYYYDFSTEAIAARMRYKNADTVKAQKHRCMKQLQAYFGKNNSSE